MGRRGRIRVRSAHPRKSYTGESPEIAGLKFTANRAHRGQASKPNHEMQHGGRCRTRTCDPLRVRQGRVFPIPLGHKGLRLDRILLAPTLAPIRRNPHRIRSFGSWRPPSRTYRRPTVRHWRRCLGSRPTANVDSPRVSGCPYRARGPRRALRVPPAGEERVCHGPSSSIES